MIDDIKDFLIDVVGEHILMTCGILCLVLALCVFLAVNVNENFIVYPFVALGVIAVIAAFLFMGLYAIIAVPFLAIPVLLPLWLFGNLIELFPTVTIIVLCVIGVLLILVDIFGEEE